MIGKKYLFIKRLVDNDHIDDEKYLNNIEYIPIYRWAVKVEDRKSEQEQYIDVITMLLSIQDNPIQFLCDILK